MLPTDIPKPEGLKVIRRFREMDSDGSGQLSLDELIQILMDLLGGKMAESNVRRLASMQFQAADRDKSGLLSVEEFLQVWSFVRQQVVLERCLGRWPRLIIFIQAPVKKILAEQAAAEAAAESARDGPNLAEVTIGIIFRRLI